jgi:phospholipid-binding lipoprotein MlaA
MVYLISVLLALSLMAPLAGVAEDSANPSSADAAPLDGAVGPGIAAPFYPSETLNEPFHVAIVNIPKSDVPQEEEEEPMEVIPDPLERVNRAFFQFNDRLYFWVLKPVASGYRAVVPQEARVGVRNFFSNVTTPIRLANCLLQANLRGARIETTRFLLNTTFGLAGFLDPARKEFRLERKEEDLGQTLGVYGMPPVFYLNWPILGPSSLRDTFGRIGDIFLNPQTYLLPSFEVNVGVRSYDVVNETSLTIGEYEDLKESALDPYTSLKDAYHQYRQNKIRER